MQATDRTAIPISTTLHNPPAEQAQAITDAVRTFAKQEGVEAITLYHDEPIWFIRRSEPVRGWLDAVLVYRLQLSAFSPSSPLELPRLYLLPDVYRYQTDVREDRFSNFDRRVTSEQVRQNTMTINIYEPTERRALPGESINDELMKILPVAWQAVLAMIKNK